MTVRSLAALLACGLTAFAARAREISLDLSQPADGHKKALAAAGVSDGTIRSHRLRPGAARVTGLAVGDVVTVRLFEDKTLSVTIVEETAALSGRAFLGRIENTLGAVGCVVLETERGLVLDVTDFDSGRVWQVVQDDSGTIVREAKPSANRHCGSDAIPAPGGRPPMSLTVTTGNGTTTVVTNGPSAASLPVRSVGEVSSGIVASPVAAAPEDGLPTVDILVNYDTDAAAWARENGGGVEAFAETCVQKMNTALANTELDECFRFRLVGVYEVGGSAGGDIDQALYFACGQYKGTLNGVSWAGVKAERERLGADIVCTLCDNGSIYGTVGLGFSLRQDSDAPSCGYNACLIRSVAVSHTMTHEVGHNMGAGHSDKMADSDNCGPQYYDYSSGYYFYVGSKGYYTIMGYNSDGYGNYYDEVPCFSSPEYTFQGVAIGTAKNDNTRTLRQNYQMVADNLRPPFVSPEIGQGFEAEEYTWTTDGRYPWSRVTGRSSDGVDSSRSCEMSGWTTSWTETRVVGPATLKFKLSLRTAYGWFEVLTDGVVSGKYGGENQTSTGSRWDQVSVTIPSGLHTVRLAYTHNGTAYTTGGNGAWVDQLTFEGGSPYVEPPEGDATATTEVPVPYSWLATYYPEAKASDYETLANGNGVNGCPVWHSYVAGLNPTSATSVFKAVIAIVDGKPAVSYTPELDDAAKAERVYTVFGKARLTDADWTAVTDGNESAFGFFKVTVRMK